jgi:hypothetical protein
MYTANPYLQSLDEEVLSASPCRRDHPMLASCDDVNGSVTMQ